MEIKWNTDTEFVTSERQTISWTETQTNRWIQHTHKQADRCNPAYQGQISEHKINANTTWTKKTDRGWENEREISMQMRTSSHTNTQQLLSLPANPHPLSQKKVDTLIQGQTPWKTEMHRLTNWNKDRQAVKPEKIYRSWLTDTGEETDIQDCDSPGCRVVPQWLCLSPASGHRRGCRPHSQWLKVKKERIIHWYSI